MLLVRNENCFWVGNILMMMMELKKLFPKFNWMFCDMLEKLYNYNSKADSKKYLHSSRLYIEKLPWRASHELS